MEHNGPFIPAKYFVYTAQKTEVTRKGWGGGGGEDDTIVESGGGYPSPRRELPEPHPLTSPICFTCKPSTPSQPPPLPQGVAITVCPHERGSKAQKMTLELLDATWSTENAIL